MLHIIQNFVSADNISFSHLLFEKALLKEDTKVGGKAFCITDDNPPIMFAELYHALSILSVTHFKANYIPGLPLLIISYIVEQYHLLQARFPKVLPELGSDLKMIQPALFSISAGFLIGSDAAAQKSIDEGGLGYKGVCTTLEGLCTQVKIWNEEHANSKDTIPSGLKAEIKNVGAAPSAIRA
jgi:hypothetical protein